MQEFIKIICLYCFIGLIKIKINTKGDINVQKTSQRKKN
jgi:hypothetical protein